MDPANCCGARPVDPLLECTGHGKAVLVSVPAGRLDSRRDRV